MKWKMKNTKNETYGKIENIQEIQEIKRLKI